MGPLSTASTEGPGPSHACLCCVPLEMPPTPALSASSPANSRGDPTSPRGLQHEPDQVREQISKPWVPPLFLVSCKSTVSDPRTQKLVLEAVSQVRGLALGPPMADLPPSGAAGAALNQACPSCPQWGKLASALPTPELGT